MPSFPPALPPKRWRYSKETASRCCPPPPAAKAVKEKGEKEDEKEGARKEGR